MIEVKEKGCIEIKKDEPCNYPNRSEEHQLSPLLDDISTYKNNILECRNKLLTQLEDILFKIENIQDKVLNNPSSIKLKYDTLDDLDLLRVDLNNVINTVLRGGK